MIKYDYNILIHTLKEVKMKKKITISIDQNAYKWAQKRAEEENRTISNWIETIIAKDEIISVLVDEEQKEVE